jgi:hypothetical protein
VRLFPTGFKGTHVDLDEVSAARAKSAWVDCPGINAAVLATAGCGAEHRRGGALVITR